MINCYSIISLWYGTANAVALFYYLIMQIDLCFKNYLLEANVIKKIYIILRRGKGYTNEIEKLNRDDSDLTFIIQLMTPVEKKLRQCIETLCANVIKGHHLKRNTYLQIMSTGFSVMVCKIFASLINFPNKRNNKLNFFADPILIKINCNRKLSLNKLTYFDGLVIHFDKIYDRL